MRVQFRLQAVIDERGTTQSQLARDSGISLATVHRIATNTTRMVRLDVLGALAAALHVEPGELVERKRR